MKKLIAMSVVAFATCAGAEETSLWSSVLSAFDDDAMVEAAAKTDAGILSLTQKINDLKDKIEKAGNLTGDKLDELKQQYADLKAKLKAKIEEYKAKQAQQTDEEKKKAKEEKAKVEQIKKDGKALVDSFKSLFKKADD